MCLQALCGPLASTWPLACNLAFRHQCGFWWWHQPETPERAWVELTSARPHKAAKHEDITKASVSSTDRICPPGSRASSQRWALAWTTGTDMAYCGIKDHSSTSMSPVPESERSSSQASVVAQSPGCMSGCRVCILCKFQVAGHHSAHTTGH